MVNVPGSIVQSFLAGLQNANDSWGSAISTVFVSPGESETLANPFSFAKGPLDRALRLANVNLHHFRPARCAGVGHVNPNALGIARRFFQLHIGHVEVGIAQPKSEREERIFAGFVISAIADENPFGIFGNRPDLILDEFTGVIGISGIVFKCRDQMWSRDGPMD